MSGAPSERGLSILRRLAAKPLDSRINIKEACQIVNAKLLLGSGMPQYDNPEPITFETPGWRKRAGLEEVLTDGVI